MADSWLASTARHQFTDVVDAAIEGRPQFIHRRDGREVVVVSREYYEKTKRTLKDVLLQDGFAEDDDDFDSLLQEARVTLSHSFTPRIFEMETPKDVRPRHRRRKPLTEKES